MKVEIEVELPEDISKDWEVVALRRAEVDEIIAVPHCDAMVAMRSAVKTTFPEIILRRKINPRDWWPRWLLAEAITLEINAVIKVRWNGEIIAYWHDESGFLDLSWIPEHLRRSGITIQNPWKGEKQ